MILTDNETKVDLLNNEVIATIITNHLKSLSDQAITIGIHGDWGAGKSSLLMMIEDMLVENEGILCIKFNGWRYQGFEDAKIALIEDIVTELTNNPSLSEKIIESVKDIFKRIDYLKIARHGGGLALTTLTGIPSPDQINTTIDRIKDLIGIPSHSITQENCDKALVHLQKLMVPKESKRLPEEIGEFRKNFSDLLDKVGVKQLVVLIDDLDRCLPETVIETLEAVRLFLFTERTAFIVAADEAMIEYSVHKHFPALPDTSGPRDYARNYLEKLIQVPFRIPALGETETRIYITLLLIGSKLGEKDENYITLIEVARNQLKRPWEVSGLDIKLVKETLGVKSKKVADEMMISDQIGPSLASGTKGNPRQIKRFLNTLLLRHQTAKARGFSKDVKIPVLAKLLLAERFKSGFFDQIAYAAAKHKSGYCEDLDKLETNKEPKTRPNFKGSKKPISENLIEKQENEKITEWKNSDWINSWVKLSPKIGKEDLRPYLFLSKDRRDYLGTNTVLGHLDDVLEQLMQSKIKVTAYQNKLSKLDKNEAEQIFEELRTRIIYGDSFENIPSGFEGITVLVKSHDFLQPKLLELLETLPPDRLGVWVTKGLSSVLKGEVNISRYNNLLTVWTAKGSKILRSAAKVAIRTNYRK